MCVSRSVVSDSFVTPWTVAPKVPLSMGFLRQEYWSGLPFPFPPSGDLPHPGIEPVSLMSSALAGSVFTTSAPWKAPGDSLLSAPPDVALKDRL